MNIVVIDHVALNELSAAWSAQFHVAKNTRVTVRIEEEEAEPAFFHNRNLASLSTN